MLATAATNKSPSSCSDGTIIEATLAYTVETQTAHCPVNKVGVEVLLQLTLSHMGPAIEANTGLSLMLLVKLPH